MVHPFKQRFDTEPLKFFTCLEYEYVQVTVCVFCENATIVHCLVIVYNHILLYLKDGHKFMKPHK